MGGSEDSQPCPGWEGRWNPLDNSKGVVSPLIQRAVEEACTTTPSHGVYQGLTEKANVSSRNWSSALEGTH